jgi:hypothetical protein
MFVLVYFKKFRKVKWKTRRSKRYSTTSKEGKSHGFSEDGQGVLWYEGRICVQNIKELKYKILREAHESAYSIHPGGNKTYHDLKATYWWYGMKRVLAVLKPNKIIRKRTEANYSSFHLRVFLGLLNPQGQRQNSTLSIPRDNFRERKAKFNLETSRTTQMQLDEYIHVGCLINL